MNGSRSISLRDRMLVASMLLAAHRRRRLRRDDPRRFAPHERRRSKRRARRMSPRRRSGWRSSSSRSRPASAATHSRADQALSRAVHEASSQLESAQGRFDHLPDRAGPATAGKRGLTRRSTQLHLGLRRPRRELPGASSASSRARRERGNVADRQTSANSFTHSSQTRTRSPRAASARPTQSRGTRSSSASSGSTARRS